MRRWLITTLFLSLAFLFAFPPSAHAQDKAKAVKLIAKGDALLEKGDRYYAANKLEKGLAAYDEALAAYNEAYDAFPSPQIYFPMAEAEQKLGLFLEAMRHLQAVLKETEKPDSDLVDAVDAAIAEVRKNLSGLEIIVDQDGAVVRLDGKKLGKTPLEGIHYFSSGKVKYTVTLDGHTPIEETIDPRKGEVVRRQHKLEPMPVVVKPKGEKPPKPVIASPPNKKPMTISFGVAGGFLIGATFTAIQAKARHDRYQDTSASNEERETAKRRGKSYRLWTDILLGGAGAAAAYGVYYYYSTYKPKKNEKESLASTIWVSPYANTAGGGVAMGASF